VGDTRHCSAGLSARNSSRSRTRHCTGLTLQLQHNEDDQSENDDEIVVKQQQQHDVAHKGRWWEKWAREKTVDSESHHDTVTDHLEGPTTEDGATPNTPSRIANDSFVVPAYAPGRRLEGDQATRIQIPLTYSNTMTKQKSIARQAALREWELKTAHGLNSNHPPLLDGRLFFSAAGSYPMSVFSMQRYEPRKEEAAQRRQKLEARGGGGSHFVSKYNPFGIIIVVR
jgi:hypothetical protein